MTRAARVVAVAAAAALAALLSFPAFLALRAAGSAVFEPERFDFVLLGAAVFGIAIGVQLVPWRRARRVALLALFASATLLFAFIAMFSIGLAILPLGIVLLIVLFRVLMRERSPATRAGALGGAAIGYSAVLLYLAVIVPATAECFPNGAGTSSGRWSGGARQMQSGGGMGGGRSETGVFTGRSEFADSTVTFRCEGGRMVEFKRTPR